MPFYVMVYGVKDMLELTVTQHKTYTKGITYIFIKITNTQESPPLNYYTLCIALFNTLMEEEEYTHLFKKLQLGKT